MLKLLLLADQLLLKAGGLLSKLFAVLGYQLKLFEALLVVPELILIELSLLGELGLQGLDSALVVRFYLLFHPRQHRLKLFYALLTLP